MSSSVQDREVTILDHVKAAFERDWRSFYAKSLQGNGDQQSKFGNLHQAKIRLGKKKKNQWKNPLFL